MNCFAEKLQKALDCSGKTQQQLADSLGLHAGTISNYLKGKYSPKNPERVIAIAKFLGVEPSWLAGCEIYESDTKDPENNKQLTHQEEEFLAKYKKLNALGRSRADEYVSDLTEHAKYTSPDDDDDREVIKTA